MADDLPPSRLLLVEGADDEHVVRRLCDRQQNMPDFDIDKRGFPNLKAAIGPEIKAPGRTALGILVDANDDHRGAMEGDSLPLGAGRHQLAAATNHAGRDRR